MKIDLLRNHENGPIAQSWKLLSCCNVFMTQLCLPVTIPS